MVLHISYTNYSIIRKPVRDCPHCKTRRRMLECFQEWYGWTNTCLTCGEMWTDGEWHPRPFERGWRKANIDSANKVWTMKQEARP